MGPGGLNSSSQEKALFSFVLVRMRVGSVACGILMHECVCRCMRMCVDARGDCQLSSSYC